MGLMILDIGNGVVFGVMGNGTTNHLNILEGKTCVHTEIKPSIIEHPTTSLLASLATIE